MRLRERKTKNYKIGKNPIKTNYFLKVSVEVLWCQSSENSLI